MKKGISLMVLMITVVIMIIMVSVVTISSRDALDTSRKMTFAIEISLLQEFVNTYYQENMSLPILEEMIIEVPENGIEQFQNEDINNGQVTLYTIDLEKMDPVERIYGNGQADLDVYVVSNKTHQVYYLKGVHTSKESYYTLTEDLKTLIRYENGNILKFEELSKNWTNQNVITKVTIPEEYQNVTISVLLDGKEVQAITDITEKSYIIDQVAGNYLIQVSYEINHQKLQTSYQVTSYDNQAPEFYYHYDSLQNAIVIEDIKDSSGIKSLKYAKKTVAEEQIVDYFSREGIPVNHSMILLDSTDEVITIYIEDNASNYTYEIVEVGGINEK